MGSEAVSLDGFEPGWTCRFSLFFFCSSWDLTGHTYTWAFGWGFFPGTISGICMLHDHGHITGVQKGKPGIVGVTQYTQQPSQRISSKMERILSCFQLHSSNNSCSIYFRSETCPSSKSQTELTWTPEKEESRPTPQKDHAISYKVRRLAHMVVEVLGRLWMRQFIIYPSFFASIPVRIVGEKKLEKTCCQMNPDLSGENGFGMHHQWEAPPSPTPNIVLCGGSPVAGRGQTIGSLLAQDVECSCLLRPLLPSLTPSVAALLPVSSSSFALCAALC